MYVCIRDTVTLSVTSMWDSLSRGRGEPERNGPRRISLGNWVLFDYYTVSLAIIHAPLWGSVTTSSHSIDNLLWWPWPCPSTVLINFPGPDLSFSPPSSTLHLAAFHHDLFSCSLSSLRKLLPQRGFVAWVRVVNRSSRSKKARRG